MMLRKILILFLALICFLSFCFSQTFSNKGKEFWVVFPPHQPSQNGGLANLSIYITSDKESRGKILINGVVEQEFIVNPTLPPIEYIIDRNKSYISSSESANDFFPTRIVNGKGIKIIVDEGYPSVVVYAHMYAGARSAATLVLPKSVLQRKYMVMSYTQTPNGLSQNEPAKSQFSVVALENNTRIKILLKKSGSSFGIPYEVVLPKQGDVYQFQDDKDLTGTEIESVAFDATTSCKKIAVFSGSSGLRLPFDASANDQGNPSVDPLFQECYPENSWGYNYFVTPFSNKTKLLFRILAREDNTEISISGRLSTIRLNRGEFYESSSIENQPPLKISSNKQITVAQYILTQNQDISVGDPDMVILNGIEQNIKNVTVFMSSKRSIQQHYINVIIKNDGIPSFAIDNGQIPVSPTEFIPINGTEYSYLQKQIFVPVASYRTINLSSNSGFNAFCYGYGEFESYSYSAGSNVIDLNQFVSVDNVNATVNFPATCVGSPFNFSVTLPFKPLKIEWKFNNINERLLLEDNTLAVDPPAIQFGGLEIPPYREVESPNDPTKTLFVYKLDDIYKFKNRGDFPIKILIVNPSGDGCTGEQEIDYDVRVFDPPVTKLTALSTGCVNEQLSLSAVNTLEDEVEPLKYIWDINGVTSESTVAIKDSVLSTEGVKNIQLKLITNIGCVSPIVDTTISISAKPKIDFSSAAIRCLDKPFILSDQSIPGSASSFSVLKNWQWEFNGIKEDSTTVSTNPSKSFAEKTAAVKLIVSSETGCVDSVSKSLTIYPNPVVDFELPESCVKDVSTFNGNLVTIEDGRGLTKFEWEFGNPGSPNPFPNSIITSSPNAVQHFYTAAGAYTVKLGVTSQDGCYELKDTVFEVNGADPIAVFDVLNSAALCSNTPIDLVNKSYVNSFGKVTRVRLFWEWDPLRPLPDNSADFTDERPAIDKQYANTYTDFNNVSSKTFNIRMVAYSGESCFTDTIKTVTIGGSPTVTFNDIPGICLDTENRSIFNLAAQQDVNGLLPGQGVFSGPGVSSAGLFSPYLVGAGDFPLRYTFTAANGCFDTLTKFIKVWPSPVASFSTSSLICEKNEITFTSTGDPVTGSITNYYWNYSDNSSIDFTQNIHRKTFAVYGNYNVQHVVVTSNGCRDTLISPIEINPNPVVDFSLAKPICLPDGLAEFTNLTSTPDNKAMSYLWDYGDPGGNNQGTSVKGIHAYGQLKDYAVKLITTIPSTGCKDSLTKPIQQLVDIFPQPEAAINSKDFVCIGTPIDFTEITDTKSAGAASIVEWNWDFVFASTKSKDPSYLFTKAGTYTVKMTATSDKGCVSNVASKTVTIHPFPEISAGPDINVLDNGQKQILATAKGTDLSFSWSPGTYLSATNVLQPVVTYPIEDIVYTLKVTGIGGCERTDKVKIVALKLIDPPNTFTPNGDGINDLWEIKNLNLYIDCVLEIYTPQGIRVYRAVNYNKPWDGTNNGRPLPAGTYYYVINTNSERKTIAGYVTILK